MASATERQAISASRGSLTSAGTGTSCALLGSSSMRPSCCGPFVRRGLVVRRRCGLGESPCDSSLMPARSRPEPPRAGAAERPRVGVELGMAEAMETGAPAASDRAQPACLAEREAGGRASLLPLEDAAAAVGASPGDALCAGGTAVAGLAVKPNLNNGLWLILPATLGAAPPGEACAGLRGAVARCPA